MRLVISSSSSRLQLNHVCARKNKEGHLLAETDELSAGNTCFMNANLQMLLHAPPVQAVLCSMPVPPPPSDGPPTPRAEEPARSLVDPPLVQSSGAEDKTGLGAGGSTGAADAASHGGNSAEATDDASSKPSSNGCSAGALDVVKGSPAEILPAEGVLCSCSPERTVLPSIEEHPEGAKVPSGTQPAQALEPTAPEQPPLPAGMTVKTSVEDDPDAVDVDADSSRSHTPASHVGVATPDIAHPPSAVEALQRGHQPWQSAEAPASLLQTGVNSSERRDGSPPAASTSSEEPAAAEGSVADTASVLDATPGAAGSPAGAAQAGGDSGANSALPPPEAAPALKPGELFSAFRRFAHEVGAALSVALYIPSSRCAEGLEYAGVYFRASAPASVLHACQAACPESTICIVHLHAIQPAHVV